MTLLGIVTMSQGFVTTPGGLYACRTIMGIFEGSLGPAAALSKHSNSPHIPRAVSWT